MEHVLRRVEHLQDAVAEHGRDRRGDNRNHGHYAHGVGHVGAHLGIVLSPELLRHGYCEARAGAVAEAEHEEHHRRRRPDGGQRIDTDEAANDGRVDEQVHLLQYVAAHERQRELYDVARRRPYGHVVDAWHILSSVLKNRAKVRISRELKVKN